MRTNFAGIVTEKMSEARVIRELRENGPFDLLTTYFEGCWYDVEFAAHCAGYNVCRMWSKELQEAHKFSEYYHFYK